MRKYLFLLVLLVTAFSYSQKIGLDQLRFVITDTEPAAIEGYLYFDDSEGSLKQYNGSAWVALGAGAGDVTAASNFGTDNLMIKSDGTLKGVQATGVLISDTNQMTNLAYVQTVDATITDDLIVAAGGEFLMSPRAEPVSTNEGTLYWDSTENTLKQYNGTSWEALNGGGGGLANVVEDVTPQLGGPLDMNSQTITGTILPTTDDIYDLGSGTFRWGNANLSGIDLDGNLLFNPTDTEPAGTKGRLYFDDSENTLKQYNGTAWEALNTGADGLGPDGDVGSGTVGGSGTTFTLDASSVGTTNIINETILDEDLADNTIKESSLNLTNAVTDNYILSANSVGDNFTWVDPSTIGAGADGLGPDGDKGDITVGGTGTTLTIDALAVGTTELAGSAVTTDKIGASQITVVKLDQSATFNNGDLFSYNSAGGNFAPIDPSTVGAAADGLGPDGDKGDITVGGSGTTLTIDNDAVDAQAIATGAVTASEIDTGAVGSGEILDGQVSEVDLNITNAPTDNYILSADTASGGFTWVVGGSGADQLGSDLDRGDITVSGTGTIATIDANTIDASHVTDGTLWEADFNITNAVTDNYVLTANTAGNNFTWVDPTTVGPDVGAIVYREAIAISDNTTALTTGVKMTWYSPPYAITITDAEASLLTAATGAGLIVDVHDDGVTIMGTNKLDIDVSEFHTKDAGTQPAISAGSIAAGSKLEAEIDQIGSTIAGAGGIVYIYYTID